MSLKGNNVADNIWNFLKDNGYTNAGASAIMGNLYAESGLKSNNLENSYEKDSNMSDTYYTESINKNSYSKDDFINDGAGYGIAQWTYPSRKKLLYENTVEKGISIDDLESQLRLLIHELKSYKKLNTFLKASTSVNNASDRFLKEFERPAILNYSDRRKISMDFYSKYVDKVNSDGHSNIENGSSDYETYEVKENDSWWSIASSKLGSGTRYPELARFNSKDPDDIIHPGDILVLPILKNDKPIENIDTKYFTQYTVKSGDTWWSIANNFLSSGADADKLARYNGRNPKSYLYENDIIKIPYYINNDNPSYKTYTVQKGECWFTIAKNLLGSGSKMNELAEFNNSNIRYVLNPGDTIKIPI